jgi:hypothetical protein
LPFAARVKLLEAYDIGLLIINELQNFVLGGDIIF